MTDPARRARRLRKAELALRALAQYGNAKRAAEHLGIAEKTLRQRVNDYLSINGFDSIPQATYWLDRPGRAEIGTRGTAPPRSGSTGVTGNA